MAATRSLSAAPRKKKQQVPFYEAPEEAPARIITEARQSVRAIPTDRPYTPAHHRNLFGGGGGSQSRPPSAFSIGARHFVEESARPGTGHKLPPIEKTFAESSNAKKLPRSIKPTPPTPVQSIQDLLVYGSPPHSKQQHVIHSPPPNTTSSSSSSSHPPSIPLGTSLEPGLQSTHASEGQVSGPIPSGGDLTSSNSGELELKQSQFSPLHSKRSLSADTVKRFLAGQLENGGGRVISAGNERKEHLSMQTEDKRRGSKRHVEKGGATVSASTSQPSRESRKSTADLPVWKAEVVPLLQELETTPYQQVGRLCASCSSLWACLKDHTLLGRTGGVGGAKRRSAVLKTVFKLLDHKDPGLLLKVAKIIVAMQVTGKNLLNVSKLLLSLGKDEANDKLFEMENLIGYLIEALMLASPLKEQETMVYGLGVVKLLASSPALRKQMLETDKTTSFIVNTLEVCCEAYSGSHPQLSPAEMTQMRNVLIQLTGALRSLSDADAFREEFVSSNIPSQLASVLTNHITSADIVFNISRVLSKLTLDSNCLAAVLECPSLLPPLLQAISLHAHHTDIVVRVCFILGNMTADHAHTRHALFFQHSSMLHINQLFLQYLKELVSDSQQGAKPSSKWQDVLIKLVRLIANLSVHPEVGPRIAGDKDTIQCLLLTLADLPLLESQELVLNTLAALNNLSYYAHSLPDSPIVQRLEEVAELMVKVLMVESTELLLECTRVCGNLSRYPQVRSILVRNKVDEIMVTILDSGRREMVFSACGVLINILADSAYHQNVAENGGVQKLVEVLRDFGKGDWQLASLVCKTLWNLSETLTSSLSCFGEAQTIQLVELLANFSNESFALSDCSDNQSLWQEEFIPVAQALLTRVKAHTSDLIPLQATNT